MPTLLLLVCTPLVCLGQYPFDTQAAAAVNALPELPLSLNYSAEVYWLDVNDKTMTIEWFYAYRQDFRDSRLRYNETLYGPSIAYNDGTVHTFGPNDCAELMPGPRRHRPERSLLL